MSQMKKITHIDVGELSLYDFNRFLDFIKRHKDQSISEVVESWNKYSKGIHQHIFIKESITY